jgi:A118 family predicted phage portal protein
MAEDLLKKRLGIQNGISTKMKEALLKWKKAYMNESSWIKDDVESLELPASISSEIARLVTIESTITFSDGVRANFLSKQLDYFRNQKKGIVEMACAIGGMYFKPYVNNGKLIIDYIYQDEAIPFRFDSEKRITGVIFPTFLVEDNKRYVRLEIHDYSDGRYTISNRCFVSKDMYLDGPVIGNLGNEIDIKKVKAWENIEPLIEVSGTDGPLFSYFRIPLSNNIDRKSPLGVSVFSRALKRIRKADIQASRLDWEFESKETAIELDESYLMEDIYGNKKLPKGKERMYRTYSGTDTFDKEKIFEHFSPNIRDQSFINGLDRYLRDIEFNSGLAYGTLSNPQNIDKTAEEIKASKQRSYQLVKDIQNSLEEALKELIRCLDELTTAYSLVPDGEYNVLFGWDDSIIVDAAKEKQQDIQDINTGVLNKYEYRMKWYGEDEETAKSKIAEMNSGKSGISSAFGNSDYGDE